ncbi:MAG: hypothetical protein KKD38_05490 [Candidatus Delongbacteria bacterium]|nr:hypothetical protein [Candidatus Delongbacteria bacterium]MCG2759920.1 hypothetical protein [Candidatus Delongbacteria bacterium]
MSKIEGKSGLGNLNSEEIKGYLWVKTRKRITKKEYSDEFGYDIKKAQRHLAKMRDQKLIKLLGRGKNAFYETLE